MEHLSFGCLSVDVQMTTNLSVQYRCTIKLGNRIRSLEYSASFEHMKHMFFWVLILVSAIAVFKEWWYQWCCNPCLTLTMGALRRRCSNVVSNVSIPHCFNVISILAYYTNDFYMVDCCDAHEQRELNYTTLFYYCGPQ